MKWITLWLTVLFLPIANAKELAETKKILFLGDSLMAGYGIKRESSAPFLLEAMLNKERAASDKVQVVNASVSGSTSASAFSRLQWQMKQKPYLFILSLGANDGLRGVKIEETQKNLQKVIKLAKENKLKTLLVGMQLPINYGEKYRLEFEKMYLDLAKTNQLPLLPFLLEGIGGVKQLNLEDGIHPNEKGHKIMAETLFKHVKPLL